jgi:hypothetical protein
MPLLIISGFSFFDICSAPKQENLVAKEENAYTRAHFPHFMQQRRDWQSISESDWAPKRKVWSESQQKVSIWMPWRFL